MTDAPWALAPTRQRPRAPFITPRGTFEDRTKRPGEDPVITIARSAHDLIIRTIQDDPLNHLEIGGGLFGSAVENFAGKLNVTRTAGPGRNSKRSRTAFAFNGVDLDEQAGDLDTIGIWHTHPKARNGHLSGEDIDTFQRCRETFPRPVGRFIGVVAYQGDPPPLRATAPRTPRHDARKRWASPILQPYIFGGKWYERARFQVVPDPTPAVRGANPGKIARAGEAPTQDLYRGLTDVAASGDPSRPTLVGHFAVYDTWTEINSPYEGRFLEKFARDSLKRTITENDRIRVLFSHGYDLYLGDKPIAVPELLRSEAGGVYYQAPLLDGVPELVVDGIRKNQYGASFRFGIVEEHWNNDPGKSSDNPLGLPERIVLDADVTEFGPTTWGAYPTATAGLRSMTDHFHALRSAHAKHEGATR